MKRISLVCALLFLMSSLHAQKPLTYYLPDVEYDENIPTPEEVLGYQIGEWHLSHDRLYMYMRELAAASDRIMLQQFAYTYEDRPLIYLLITSPENHANIDEIKAQHVQLTDPDASSDLNTADMPSVVYQGFSIHGNEPSGSNAAPLVAYYLAAAQTEEVEELLDNVVVLLDPSFNPDGFHRFSTWVNTHKGINALISDPQSREYNETWPRGRTNHYWFDLNRDWLPVQHPESQGRIANFHEWKPNILTDHHEMGSSSTFFFQPGVPQRTNPLTPQKNQDLTGEIAEFHAAALDEIGSLYYSQEGFDDFYYGKGSTYPDVNGSIGILFEQASSRGHYQQTVNGILDFPFTIRNQVTTALSTLEAAKSLRQELLDWQREFYQSAMKEAAEDVVKAYVFADPEDPAKVAEFLKILQQHKVKVHKLAKNANVEGKSFTADEAYVVPTNQPQYRLVKGMFGTMTSFKDSLFYDVSAWTLPLAFNLQYAELEGSSFAQNMLGDPLEDTEMMTEAPAFSDYAYLIGWDGYFAPKVLNTLFDKGLRAKVNTAPFTLGGKNYDMGMILVPVQNQNHSPQEMHELMQELAAENHVKIEGVETGLTEEGIDLGSPSFDPLRQPKVVMVVDGGVSSYDAGEVWHLLDQRYHMPVTMIEADDMGGADLSDYNTLVMVGGYYGSISSGGLKNIKEWVQNGGVLIATESATSWAKSQGLAYFEEKNGESEEEPTQRPYSKIGPDRGRDYIGGSIFEAKLDMTHPLAFGYNREILPVFKGNTRFFEPTRNPYAAPLRYTDEPLLSGYISAENLETIKNASAIVVSGTGRGRVICMADNPNFRAFWYGTNKLFANAMFFGNLISGAALERAPRGGGEDQAGN